MFDKGLHIGPVKVIIDNDNNGADPPCERKAKTSAGGIKILHRCKIYWFNQWDFRGRFSETKNTIDVQKRQHPQVGANGKRAYFVFNSPKPNNTTDVCKRSIIKANCNLSYLYVLPLCKVYRTNPPGIGNVKSFFISLLT